VTDLAIKFWTDKGVLKKPIEAKDIIEPKFVEQASK